MTDRRAFLAASGALALSACAAAPLGSRESTEVPAPRWSVGTSWTYRRTDAYNGLDRGAVTRSVESVTEKNIRVVTRQASGLASDDALFASPGIQLSGTLNEEGPFGGVFSPALRTYDFPLASGKRWEQRLTRTDSNQSHYYFTSASRAEGWEDVQFGGRAYRAIIVRRTLRFFWPIPPYLGVLNRQELEWYVAEIGAGARLRIAEWFDTTLHSQPWTRLNVELESFKLA